MLSKERLSDCIKSDMPQLTDFESSDHLDTLMVFPSKKKKKKLIKKKIQKKKTTIKHTKNKKKIITQVLMYFDVLQT